MLKVLSLFYILLPHTLSDIPEMGSQPHDPHCLCSSTSFCHPVHQGTQLHLLSSQPVLFKFRFPLRLLSSPANWQLHGNTLAACIQLLGYAMRWKCWWGKKNKNKAKPKPPNKKKKAQTFTPILTVHSECSPNFLS